MSVELDRETNRSYFTRTAGMSGQDKHRECIARLSDGAGDVRPGSAGARARA